MKGSIRIYEKLKTYIFISLVSFSFENLRIFQELEHLTTEIL